jgi:MarR-like DNA-binding transcriptional regulator SgrR of sgrS sRNA
VDHLGCEEAFRKKLTSWLTQAQESLKNLNTLTQAPLVPYSILTLHSLWAYQSCSCLYVDAMHNTLFKFDNETETIRPHLAHYYKFRGDEL